MRHFTPIAGNVDTVPLMNALANHPELWNEHRLRTTFEGTPHGEVDDIWLRFNADLGQEVAKFADDLEAVWYPAADALRPAREIVANVMGRLWGERLGRVLITRLAPGKRILPHRDVIGKYASYYSRYHVSLCGHPGSLFRAADETVTMRTGEVWRFDASAEHEVINNSADDRINLLIDIRCT
jgi:hypothetical protein